MKSNYNSYVSENHEGFEIRFFDGVEKNPSHKKKALDHGLWLAKEIKSNSHVSITGGFYANKDYYHAPNVIEVGYGRDW